MSFFLHVHPLKMSTHSEQTMNLICFSTPKKHLSQKGHESIFQYCLEKNETKHKTWSEVFPNSKDGWSFLASMFPISSLLTTDKSRWKPQKSGVIIWNQPKLDAQFSGNSPKITIELYQVWSSPKWALNPWPECFGHFGIRIPGSNHYPFGMTWPTCGEICRFSFAKFHGGRRYHHSLECRDLKNLIYPWKDPFINECLVKQPCFICNDLEWSNWNNHF